MLKSTYVSPLLPTGISFSTELDTLIADAAVPGSPGSPLLPCIFIKTMTSSLFAKVKSFELLDKTDTVRTK